MLSRNSTVAFHGAPETNIPFEIWMRLTPSPAPPPKKKFVLITPFLGPFITNVEGVPSLFFADENIT